MPRKSTDLQAPVPGVLVPSSSAFDFLEGAFARAERARLAGLVIVGASAVAVAGVLAAGGLALAEVQSQSAAMSSAQADLGKVTAQLASVDAAGGMSSAQLIAHIASRTSTLKAAVGHEVNTVGVLNSLWASAPAGVDITAVKFSATDTTGKPLTLTVSAHATAFTLISQWNTALAATRGLTGVDVTWTGGGDNVALTVTASLNADADSARSAELAKPATGPAAGTATAPAASATNPQSTPKVTP